MFDSGGGDRLDVGTIKVCILNVIEKGITPVKFVCFVVNAESVRPSKKDTPEYHDTTSIQMGSTDVCRPIPLREEDITSVWMDDDGSRSFKVLQECPSIS